MDSVHHYISLIEVTVCVSVSSATACVCLSAWRWRARSCPSCSRRMLSVFSSCVWNMSPPVGTKPWYHPSSNKHINLGDRKESFLLTCDSVSQTDGRLCVCSAGKLSLIRRPWFSRSKVNLGQPHEAWECRGHSSDHVREKISHGVRIRLNILYNKETNANSASSLCNVMSITVPQSFTHTIRQPYKSEPE